MRHIYRILGVIVGSIMGLLPTFATSNVPPEYYANYHIANEWSALLDTIIDLDAAWNVGAEVPASTFRKLHAIFEKVFDYFPSDPNSELIYRQCLLVTDELATEVTKNTYAKFKDQCFSPISSLLQKIQTKFTVKPSIKASPKSGSAPLAVTFDARDSVDPSNDTIPSDHYYRWYRDVYGNDQVIGKNPTILHEFTEPGNHIVHLTVRSSNNITQGIFDGEESIAINVAPEAANVVIYANGKKLSEDDVTRLGTQDAQGGILIDATATRPTGSRTIIEHTREITSTEQKYSFKQSAEGSPGQFVHIFPGNGIYYVTLTLEDNENNMIRKRYELAVSDPVAAIRLMPEEGDTSSTYVFDGSASYSLTSRVSKYQREVTDPNGDKIEAIESKKLKRKFAIPGPYVVKLTVTDSLGNISYDTQEFYVASTPPVPSFTIEPSSDLKEPSEFLLNASATFDEDVLNGNDALTYTWSYTPSDDVVLTPQDDQQKKALITFNEIGTYTVRLLVEDAYGELAEIEKEIEVTSTLRPTMQVDPIVGHRGNPMQLTAQTNKPVALLEWNLGDGNIQKTTQQTIEYTYEKAGVYDVELHAITANQEENTITQQVFMGQKDYPIVGYAIKGRQGVVLQKDALCENASGDKMGAFSVDRYMPITIDATSSLNTQGTTTDLSVTIHPNNNEVFAKKVLNHDFKELGCTFVDIYVEDSNIGKTAHQRIWFEVNNALPTIKNLLLDFPQPGGTTNIGVGVGVAKTKNLDVFNNPAIDPVVVKVQAKGTQDPDGFISHYAWYYYEKNNPDNILSLKITPSDVPSTSFVIPKPHHPTEYAFAVRIIDNDGAEVTSEQILGAGPMIFFPPGENNLDVPIVTLQADKSQVVIGDEITFTADSRILSQKPDFATTRYFKYDFDGDGAYDLTSKNNVVTYRYEKPGEKKPKVAVYYRGRAGISNSDSIIVQKGLKPLLEIATAGTEVLIQDMSMGDIDQTTLCMDIRRCSEEEDRVIKNKEVVYFDYEEPGDYYIQFDLMDVYGNTVAPIRKKIHLEPENDMPLSVLSIPKLIVEEGREVINVGNMLDNTIQLRVGYEGSCYIDTDITSDTDEDGDPTNDNAANCNMLESHTFIPQAKEQTMRIRYAHEGQKKHKDILVNFIDYEEVVPDGYEWAVNDIAELLDVLPEDDDNELLRFYKDLLINLQKSLGETDQMSSLVIQLRDLLAERPDVLNTAQQERLNLLLNALSDATVEQVYDDDTPYDAARSNISAWFSDEVKEEIETLFTTFEEQQGNKDAMKSTLDEVFKIAGRERQLGTLDAVDMTYIQKNLCDIIVYYELPSKTCGTEVVVDEDVEVTTGEDASGSSSSSGSSSLTKKIIRIVIIVVIVLAAIFAGLVVLFAIKAKRQQQLAEDENDDDLFDDDLGIELADSSFVSSTESGDETTQDDQQST